MTLSFCYIGHICRTFRIPSIANFYDFWCFWVSWILGFGPFLDPLCPAIATIPLLFAFLIQIHYHKPLFIAVTDTNMPYLETQVRQNLGFR